MHRILHPQHAHTTALCTAKALALQSPSERRAYAAFLERLAARARALAGGCSPAQAAGIIYGLAALDVRDGALVAALTDAVAPALSRGAAAVRAADADGDGGGAGAADADAAGNGGVLTAAEAASLLWGLGTVGQRPEAEAWLDDCAECCRPLLPE